jgi:3-oxoacyl-(acyl-carrier-protein) synthase
VVQNLDTEGLISKKNERRFDPTIKYTMAAGKKALRDAGLPWDGAEIKDINLARAGILIGEGQWVAWGGFGRQAAYMQARTPPLIQVHHAVKLCMPCCEAMHALL